MIESKYEITKNVGRKFGDNLTKEELEELSKISIPKDIAYGDFDRTKKYNI